MEKNKFIVPQGGYHTKDIKEATHKAASMCYGVVAIAKRDDILRRDKRLKKGIVEEAIYVNKNPNGTFSVDVYLILSNEVKITESLVETQKILMYQLNKTFTNCCMGVNVYCEKISSNH